ncbi:MAG: YihY/virulence factor BrkB family protein [Candidatus Dormibacteria bacterium]
MPGKLVAKIGEDRAINWATLIAWSGLLAMFPILLVGASILVLALGAAGFTENDVVSHLSGAIHDPGTRNLISGALAQIKNKFGVVALVGIVGLMFGGSALFGSMEQGFAIIYHTKPRPFLRQKLMAMALIVPFSLLAGLAIMTSSALPALKAIPNIPEFLSGGPVSYVLQVGIGAISGSLLFLLVYYVVPNRRQELAKVWPGALAAGVLFSLLVLLFPFYLEINKGLQRYGQTPALFLTLMTFFFFLGIITMVGVELNSVLYPLPVEQPEKAEALAPEDSTTTTDSQVGSVRPARADRLEPARRGPGGVSSRTTVLVGVGAVAWLAGLLMGRRAGGGH